MYLIRKAEVCLQIRQKRKGQKRGVSRILTVPWPIIMASKRDDVDWNNLRAIWSRITSVKSSVTRACTAIDKLTGCPFIYSTPAACDDARKRLTDAFNFCVELHDRWTDLENKAGNQAASETSNTSLAPYEEKQFSALAKLTEYVDKNSAKSPAPAPSTSSGTVPGTVPKITTCKLLFPKELTKENTPSEFRLWVASFRRFHEASNLKQQPALWPSWLPRHPRGRIQDDVPYLQQKSRLLPGRSRIW